MVLASHLLVKSFAFVFPGTLNWGFVRCLVFSFIPFLYVINGCICLSCIIWCFDTHTGCSWFRSASPKFSSIFSFNGHHVGDLFDAQYTLWGINLYILSFSVVFWAGYYTAQAGFELFISCLSGQPGRSGARDAPASVSRVQELQGSYPAPLRQSFFLRFACGSRMHVASRRDEAHSRFLCPSLGYPLRAKGEGLISLASGKSKAQSQGLALAPAEVAAYGELWEQRVNTLSQRSWWPCKAWALGPDPFSSQSVQSLPLAASWPLTPVTQTEWRPLACKCALCLLKLRETLCRHKSKQRGLIHLARQKNPTVIMSHTGVYSFNSFILLPLSKGIVPEPSFHTVY